MEALELVWRRGVQALVGRGASGCSRTLLRGGERAGRPAPCVGFARSLCGVLFALAWGRWGPRRRWPGGSPWSVAFPDDRGISAHVAGCGPLAGCHPARRTLQVVATCSCKSWWVDVGPGAGGCCSVLPEGPPAPTQTLPPSPGPAGSLTGASGAQVQLFCAAPQGVLQTQVTGGLSTSSQDVAGEPLWGGPSVTRCTAVRAALGSLLTHVGPRWALPSRRCAWRKFGELGCSLPPPAALPDWLRTGRVTARPPSQTRARSRGYVGTPIARAPCVLHTPFCRPGSAVGSASPLSTCELLPGRLLLSRTVSRQSPARWRLVGGEPTALASAWTAAPAAPCPSRLPHPPRRGACCRSASLPGSLSLLRPRAAA